MAKKKKHTAALNAPSSPTDQKLPSRPSNSNECSEPPPPATADGISISNTMDVFWDIIDIDREHLRKFAKHQVMIVGLVKSMYGDAVKINPDKKTVWGVPILGMEIALSASSSAAVYVRLIIDMPPEYPKVAPIVNMEELEPNDAGLIQTLKSTVKRVTDTEAGDEQMVISILTEVEQTLNDYSDDQKRRAQGASLEQERATNVTAAQANANNQKQLDLAKRQAETAAKEAELAKGIESVRKRRQLLSAQEPEPEHQTTDNEDYPKGCVVFGRDITCHDFSIDTDLTFRAVQPIAIIYERSDKRVLLATPYRKGSILTLQLVLKVFRLPPGMDSEAEYRTKLNNIETAIQDAKMLKHSSIVRIHDYQLIEVRDRLSTPCWELQILSEYAQTSLPDLLEMSGTLNAAKIRTFTRSILDALEFYDRKGYLHPAIHVHNILLFGSSRSNYQAKLSDGYGTALQDFVSRATGAAKSELFGGGWPAPEMTSDAPTRSNKTCIWELGVVLLQMALGNDMTKTYTSPEDVCYRAGLDPDFDHLIMKMCETSARKRPTAFQLQSHHWFKSHARSVFKAENTKARAVPSLIRSKSVHESRWASDWEPLQRLGKGGFGVVVKARNRLDGHFYAVKQLKCKSIKDTEEIWGEVRMLAQLNHPGIVRYFGAWNEEDLPEQTDDDSSNMITDPRSFAPTDSAGLRSSLFAKPSTGHDFMDPTLSRISDVEDEEERQSRNSSGSSSSSDSSGGLFGYQSAPSTDQGESQAIQFDDDNAEEEPSDPFQLENAAKGTDDGPNIFESDDPPERPAASWVPTSPQPILSPRGTPSILRRPPDYYKRPSTLYIQMELCETGTLLDLIRNGLPNNVEEGWRIFRLLLDGLEHIHNLKVVHRDLKPMNIFIDSQKMPKIGDFGLASPSQATIDGHKVATHIAGPMSKGVGTLFYIAPELDAARATGKYSAKADMFALGIIFFEMCFPFSTNTERVNWLQNINKDGSILPARFDTDEFKVQGRIIRSLLQHNPDQRPSARDLLGDPEIPEPLEEDKEQRWIQRLMHNDPAQFDKVMKNLMDKTASRPQVLAYAHVEPDKYEQPDPFLLDTICQKLSESFKIHGGVSEHRDTVFPVEGFYHNPVKFVDAAGFTVQLPYDLTVPFARSIAVREPKYSKVYCFGNVFRLRQIGVEPIAVPEIDFDLVSHSAQDLSFRDAQVISVLDDCLHNLNSLFSRSFTIVVSHGDLLDLVLRACEVPEVRFDTTKRILSLLNVGKHTWKQVSAELRDNGLTATSTTALGTFNRIAPLDEIREVLTVNFAKLRKDDFGMKAARTLTRLQDVSEYLSKMRIRTPIMFSPLSNTSEMIYRGSTMFKCVESKTGKTVAVGGRYDALIRSYQTPEQKTTCRAAGFRVNIIDLANFAKIDAQGSQPKAGKPKMIMPVGSSPRVDVLVTSFDPGTLHGSCIEILREILDAGFSAELTEPFDSMEELESAYSEMTKFWIVIVRNITATQRAIKIRAPDRNETDVQASDIIQHLREEIGERQPSISEPVLKRSRSSHGASGRENVAVFTPQHKSKKVNRAAIVDSAKSAAQELTETMGKSYKILAIDTDDETLHKMRNTRLADGGTWRSLSHAVPLNEREYIQDIQEQLEDWSKDGQQGAFICNYKTKSCIFYDFGKP